MKQWLCGLLLLLFALQVLPVRELGRLLLKSDDAALCCDDLGGCDEDCTEEKDCGTPEDFLPKLKKAEGWLLSGSPSAASDCAEWQWRQLVTSALHRAEGLIQHHFPEVQTPPPNRCA